MSRMKLQSQGKNFSLRAIVSTILGEGVDSIIFFPLALYGVVPNEALPVLMLWQVILKTLYEVLVLPLTIYIVKKVKQYEQEDAYDEAIDYRVWKIFKL